MAAQKRHPFAGTVASAPIVAPVAPQRLPALEVPAYVPPPVAPAVAPTATIGGGDKFEAFDVQIDVPPLKEIPVAQTERPWRCIDVYAGTTSGWAAQVSPANEWVTISIYAVVRGVPVLVSVGRILNNLQFTIPKRIASARVPLAEQYYVTAHSSTNLISARLLVIATDQPGDPHDADDFPGTFEWFRTTSPAIEINSGYNISNPLNSPRFKGLELLIVTAMNVNAAVRYLQFHDALDAGGNIPAGGTARLSIPLQQYESIRLGPDFVRNTIMTKGAGLVRLPCIAIAPSSAAFTYTAVPAAEVLMGILYR